MFKLENYCIEDTITAISTSLGKSAIGVIRISGKKAFKIISSFFVPFNKNKDLNKVKNYTLHYGWLVERKNKFPKIIDEVLIGVMRSPHSFTGEDVVEIYAHGGTLVLNKILNKILEKGARLALPGEFTYRAFLNKKIDLVKAESILAIIEAKTEKGLFSATSQLKGTISFELEKIKKEVKDIFVKSEALVNFPEEDISVSLEELKTKLKIIDLEIEKMIKKTESGEILKEGFKCVICGKANVGKSTLFNLFLKKERAIVSEIPGTTRDVLEEMVDLRGFPLRIFDTAGFLNAKGKITKEAIRRTKLALSEADLIILVFEAVNFNKLDELFYKEIEENFPRIPKIIVINKIDLKKPKPPSFIKDKKEIIFLNALKGEGFNCLEEKIFRFLSCHLEKDTLFLSNYQKILLKDIAENLKKTISFLEDKYSIDFISFSLQNILRLFGKITGEVFSEEILESIFSQFCIGK